VVVVLGEVAVRDHAVPVDRIAERVGAARPRRPS
jgi:hypothetical protein